LGPRFVESHRGAQEAEESVTPDALATAKGREAYEALSLAIREGEHAPGARLKEVELAEQLGMSRTPIREAFRQLERDGVVTIVPNRGAIVRELTAEEIEDVYALRAVLEGFCAARAATRMDAGGIAHLDELTDELERRCAADGDESAALIRINAAFHAAITEASGNGRVADVLGHVAEVPHHLRREAWASDAVQVATIVYHRDIVEAIRARDAVRAEAIMRSHMYSVKDLMTEQLRAAGIRNLLAGHPPEDPS
jgi:DNA-binding GntR family transcriptional regulator